jgi:hypothetical protein
MPGTGKEQSVQKMAKATVVNPATRVAEKTTTVAEKATKFTSVTVPVEVHVYPARTLFLREHVGKAERAGKTWEMALNVDGTPMIRLPDRRWVAFGWKALTQATEAIGADVAAQ